MKEEIFDIVDEDGNIIGEATRTQVHNRSFLLHKAVHLILLNDKGEILLQKRSLHKKIQPGKWDISVGGHVAKGESEIEALKREAKEEIGIAIPEPVFLYTYIWRSDVEREFVSTFYIKGTYYLSDFSPHPQEIEKLEFFDIQKIVEENNPEKFTPNLLYEMNLFLKKFSKI